MRKNELTGKSLALPQTPQDYLEGRGITVKMQSDLDIEYLTHEKATTERWGFGKQATSPDGVIIFPVTRRNAIARNYYAKTDHQDKHLLSINQQRGEQDLEPVQKVPKYVVPQGDRGKGLLYDPYERLDPGTKQPILFATEDIIGVIKAAYRGRRVVSTTGVWTVTNAELKSGQPPQLAGTFDSYLADSDALTNPSVMQALVRSAVALNCRVGCFPSSHKDIKCGLDEWLASNPDDLQTLAREQTADVLEWLRDIYPNLHKKLEELGHSPTEAAKLSEPVRRAIKRELVARLGIDTLRANGFYQSVLKPTGTTLKDLQQQQQDNRAESGEGPPPSTLVQLIDIGKEADLFHDAEDVAYADIEVDGFRQTHAVRARSFKLWLTQQLYKRNEEGAPSEALNAALNTLEAMAIFDGVERKVWLRTAKHEGKLYLDLGNKQWQAVEIDRQDWHVVDRPPVRFFRPNTLRELPMPTKEGNLEDLRELVNVGDQAWVLLITFLLFSFTQGPTFPVLMLMAARGSGKTAITEFLKSLIDPGKAGLTNLHPDAHRLGVAATKRWVLAYDNVSRITSEQSDMLCRVATGFGFSTRTLFTTADETVFEVARPQIVTAIDAIVTRDDLADRVLLVQLPSISKEQRLTKEELDTKLEKSRPGIVGALLTALSKTLKALPDIHPEELPRMADYGRFAIAAERALGWEPGTWWAAFNQSRENARAVVLESSPLAETIRNMVSQERSWSGTAQQLLLHLEKYAQPATVRAAFWPKSPTALSRQLNRLGPDLAAIGIKVSSSRSTSCRLINITEHEEKVLESPPSKVGGSIASLRHIEESQPLKHSPQEASSNDAIDDVIMTQLEIDDAIASSIEPSYDAIGEHDAIMTQLKSNCVIAKSSNNKGFQPKHEGNDAIDPPTQGAADSENDIVWNEVAS